MQEPHAAFKNCGQKEGLEIWRIENFHPVPVATSDYGKLYTGDSYIVLKTSGIPASFNYDIHFWLGTESSQDERGAAAILSVNMDEARFNGAAVQHRELQGYESQLFLEYFPPLIRYLDGGHASGFTKVTTNEGSVRRLFQIKGKKNVRVTQVEAHVSKMNAGDCFILDKDHDIFLYVGAEAKSGERLTAIKAANQIRDQDHNGRGNVQIFDPYSSDEDLDSFFTALGSGDRNSVPPASDGGDDEVSILFSRETAKEPSGEPFPSYNLDFVKAKVNTKEQWRGLCSEFHCVIASEMMLSPAEPKMFEVGAAKAVKLFEISDASGKMNITEIKPITGKEQLKTDECYFLDAHTSGVFVWVGKKSNQKEKMEAMNRADEYLKRNNCPAWIHVSKVPEGGEPAVFKMCFPNWA